MQSIGERLEEARKRKGISLREAAEATKIRGDFLGYIEQNKMDFDLPEIYKRGFLKNYARYLKLDVDKLMTDYNAQQLSNSRLGKKGGNEWFGQMEIKKAESEEHSPQERPVDPSNSAESAPYGRIGAAKPKPPADESRFGEQANDEPGEEESDKTFYMKIGLIFAGTLALVFVIFGLIWSILGRENQEAVVGGPDLRQPSASSASEILNPADPAGGSMPAAGAGNEAEGDDSITLTATGNVYILIRQQSNNAEILRRTFSEGETVTIEKEGPVDILFTAGENILIDHLGERFRPNVSGTAKITLQ